MRYLIIFALLLLATPVEAANCEEAGVTTDRHVYYIDTESIYAGNGKKRIWIKNQYPNPEVTEYLLAEFDCSGQMRFLKKEVKSPYDTTGSYIDLNVWDL